MTYIVVLNRSLASILLSAANEICPIGLVDFPQLPLSLDIRAGETDLETLLAGERELLRLVSRQVLMAVSAPFVYLETEARLDCGGNAFAAKGKTVVQPGWKAYADAELTDKALPELAEGQSLSVSSCAVKEGRTTPPKHFTDVIFCERKEWIGIEERSSA